MKLQQNELKKYINENKPMIWQYKTLYQIFQSKNVNDGELYLKQVHKNYNDGIGVTIKGRYIAMSTNEASMYIK